MEQSIEAPRKTRTRGIALITFGLVLDGVAMFMMMACNDREPREQNQWYLGLLVALVATGIVRMGLRMLQAPASV